MAPVVVAVVAAAAEMVVEIFAPVASSIVAAAAFADDVISISVAVAATKCWPQSQRLL